ncbi:MAG: chromate transporter [Proteobacteria bacterium]|nr:chromate transporter [Pseudomonadota bacterium]
MNSTLVSIALLFSQLSLLAFGGGNTILPEMHRQAVDVYHWMTDSEFVALFALAQAAPGPNMMVAPLIGWQVAGWSGLAVATLAMFGPSSIVTCVALRLWRRFKDQSWRRAIQSGLVPISVGLVAASALLIVQASDRAWILGAVTAACAIVATRTRVHPLWLLAAGGAIGWSGIGQ